MKYFLIVLLLCKQFCGFSQEINIERLNAFTDSFFRSKIGSGEYGGLGIVMVKDSAIVLKKGYGYSENKIPVNPEQTLFGAASVGKLIVATAVMQLVESGQLKLSDKVSKYVKVNNRYKTEITIGNLLSHTAGIEDSFLGAQTKADGGEVKSLKEFFEQRPPRIIYEPNEQVSYSNVGMALAGYIVEKVTGISFNEYVEKNIFQPLKMNYSSFRQPLPESLAALAVKDRRFGENSFIIPYPAGSLFTSVEDMGRFIIAHLNEGKFMQAQILQPATIKLMHQTYFSPAENIPCMALGFMESIDNGRKALYHTGSRFTQSIFYLLPMEKSGIYIVQYGYNNSIRQEYLYAFLKRFYPALPDTSLPKQQIKNNDLQKWTGLYRFNLGARTTLEKLASLPMQASVNYKNDTLYINVLLFNQKIKLTPVGNNIFKGSDGATFVFKSNSAGDKKYFFRTNLDWADPMTATKIRWYENGFLHAGIMVAGYLFLFINLLIILIRRIRKTPVALYSKVQRAWVKIIITSTILLFVAPVIGLVWVFSGAAAPIMGTPSILYVIFGMLTAGIIAGLLSLPLGFLYFKDLKKISGRIYIIALSACFVFLSILFYYWNLLGFNF